MARPKRRIYLLQALNLLLRHQPALNLNQVRLSQVGRFLQLPQTLFSIPRHMPAQALICLGPLPLSVTLAQ